MSHGSDVHYKAAYNDIGRRRSNMFRGRKLNPKFDDEREFWRVYPDKHGFVVLWRKRRGALLKNLTSRIPVSLDRALMVVRILANYGDRIIVTYKSDHEQKMSYSEFLEFWRARNLDLIDDCVGTVNDFLNLMGFYDD